MFSPLLVVAALLWLAIHIGLSGTALRGRMAAAVGERRFPGVFSLLATASLALLAYAFHGSGTVPLWYAPPWLVLAIDAVMLAAVLLFAGAVIPPRGSGPGPRGMFRVTRHPMLCAFALWAGAHMVANGDTASLLFFGTFLLTVLVGIPSIDAKLARRDPARAAALRAATSRVPFGAIVAGRNHLALGELGWVAPLAGVVGWVALLHLHPLIIGVPALPVW